MIRHARPLALLFLFTLTASAQEILTANQKPSGLYDVGEKITWKVEVKAKDPKDAAPTIEGATYTLKKNGRTVLKTEPIDLSSGTATIEASLDEPGTLLAEIKGKLNGKEIKGLAGAAIAPEKIGRSAPRPDDFDAFWKAKIDQLHAIPANPKLEPADAGKPTIEYFKLTMDNINNSHVYGQLAKPKKEGKFPALLIVQWAGVYGLQKGWVTGRADQGWLVLNIMPHDLPFDQPADFYTKAAATTHKDYMAIGDDDRERSYFLRMYLSCVRAADYLAERPDWDGKILVVTGGSQGGQQSFVTAGLHPKITAMIANVPAGCDVTGHQAGRAIGFPYWADRAGWKKNDKIVEVGCYFDAANFAPNVKCPALVGLGLIDETCPPSGIYMALNQFQGPKEAVVLPNSDHGGKHNSQAAYYARSEQWFRSLVKGETPAAATMRKD